MTALSDPLTLLFAPLALWNAVSRRGRRELVVPASLLAGLAVQLGATTLAGESPERLTRFNGTDQPLLFALRVTGSLLVGDRFLDDTWLSLGRVFAYGALLAVAAALLAGAVRSERATRLFVAVAAGYAVVLFGVFLAGRGTAGMRPGMDEASWHLAGARFMYAPILLLAAALLAVVDRPCRTRAGQPAASRLEQRSRSSRCSWQRTSISRASARWVRRGSRSSRPHVSAVTRGRTTRAFQWRRSPSASSSRRPAATCAFTPPGRRAPRRPRDVGRRRVGWMVCITRTSLASWRRRLVAPIRPRRYNVPQAFRALNCILMSYAPRHEPWLEPLEIRRYDALLTWAGRATFVYRDPPACAEGRGVCRRGEL